MLHGGVYQPVVPDEHDGLPSRVLGLTLVRWQGVYEGVEALWLRWATPDGTVLPTPQETTDAARAEAERTVQAVADARAEAERERALRREMEARITELERQVRQGGSKD